MKKVNISQMKNSRDLYSLVINWKDNTRTEINYLTLENAVTYINHKVEWLAGETK